jgi:hypothetical protein
MQIGNINPANLRGLKQEPYISSSLQGGNDVKQIAEVFDDDIQLVEIWTNFLIHNHWIQKNAIDRRP